MLFWEWHNWLSRFKVRTPFCVFLSRDCLIFLFPSYRQWIHYKNYNKSDKFRVMPSFNMVKNPPANSGDAGDVGLNPGSGRSPGVGNGNPLRYSCLENSMERGTWWAAIQGASKTWPQLSNWTHTHTIQYSSNIFPPLQGHMALWKPLDKLFKLSEVLGGFDSSPSLQEWAYP